MTVKIDVNKLGMYIVKKMMIELFTYYSEVACRKCTNQADVLEVLREDTTKYIAELNTVNFVNVHDTLLDFEYELRNTINTASLEPVELEKCITDAVCLRWDERLTKY